MENVGKYVIHGSYGDGTFFGFILGITATSRRKFVGLRSSVLGGWLSSDQANGEVSKGQWESLVSFFQNHVFSMFLKTDLGCE